MSDAAWFTWGVPVVALLFGGFIFLLAWWTSWSFDRRYGRGPK
jgi:hypothetical protein